MWTDPIQHTLTVAPYYIYDYHYYPPLSQERWQYKFTNQELVLNSTTGVFSTDIIGNELPVNTFSFTVRYNSKSLTLLRYAWSVMRDSNGKVLIARQTVDQKDYLTDLEYGAPVFWRVNGTIYAKGYVSNVERTGKYTWKVTCVSGVGLLTERMHAGGIYNNANFIDVYADIVGGTIGDRAEPYPGTIVHGVFESIVLDDVANTKVFGWLPYDTARSNLHRLLFATGAGLHKHQDLPTWIDHTIDYDVRFPSLNVVEVEDSQVALSGSVKLTLPANGAEVTEHSYSALSTDELVTLYDNTTGDTPAADHLTVVFDAPMHDIEWSAFTPEHPELEPEVHPNYAIITGTGTLTGKRYTHSETTVSVGDTSGNRVKRVTDNALITVANSANVAKRVLNYFQSAKQVKAKLLLGDGTVSVWQSLKCGDHVVMNDAWGERTDAYVAKMDVCLTYGYGANCELIEGYTPTDNGNNYTRRRIIRRQDNKVFRIPEGVTTVRIVLIQGGTGGQGGCAGHDGWGGYPPGMYSPVDGELDYSEQKDPLPQDPTVEYGRAYIYGNGRQRAELGGAAGAAGAAGKILVITKTVTRGERLTFTIGKGGTGGAAREHGAEDGGYGTAGGHTTVSTDASTWSATSADGAISETGYYEPFGDESYGLAGEIGHDGGAGGTTDANSIELGNSGASGNAGGDVGEWHGANGGKGVSVDAGWGFVGGVANTASGGGGGGAAWGARGSVGGNARYVKTAISADEPFFGIYSGAGGAGANAVAHPKPTFGNGGGGGNGGGAGGNVGGTKVFSFYGYGNNAAQYFLGLRHREDMPHVPVDPYGGGKGGEGSNGGEGGDGVAIIYY